MIDTYYTGVYIRDLTLFNIGNEKTLKNGLLNFSKIRTIVLKVRVNNISLEMTS